MLTDPISDYLTRVRNAINAGQADLEVPASRLKVELSRILSEQGYIEGYEVEPTRVGEAIRIRLRYTNDRRPVISGLERVSRPGRRRVRHRGADRAVGHRPRGPRVGRSTGLVPRRLPHGQPADDRRASRGRHARPRSRH